MYVQFVSSCFEVDVAERFEGVDFQVGEFDKDATALRETFEVGVTFEV